MDYKQLQAFVAVVEKGTEFQAAAAVYVPVSTLRERIKLLEQELGCPLLQQRGERAEMTPRGQELYRYAKQMLAVQENLLQKQGENQD